MKIIGGVDGTGSSSIGEQLGGTIGLTKLAGGRLVCTLQSPASKGQWGAAGKYCRVGSNKGSSSASKPISGVTELAKFSSTWLGHCMGPSSVNEAGTIAKVCCRVGDGESTAVDMAMALAAEIGMEIRALFVVAVALSVVAVLAAMIAVIAIAVTAKEISAVKLAHAKTAMVAAV